MKHMVKKNSNFMFSNNFGNYILYCLKKKE